MSGTDDDLPITHPLCTSKSQCISIYLWRWNKRNPASRILLRANLYSGACLDLLGMRIQHAVYVYWVLHLNSRCEIRSQWARGWRNRAREKELPLASAPLPRAPSTQFSTCWSQRSGLRETEAAWGSGRSLGRWCWLRSVSGHTLCKSWLENTWKGREQNEELTPLRAFCFPRQHGQQERRPAQDPRQLSCPAVLTVRWAWWSGTCGTLWTARRSPSAPSAWAAEPSPDPASRKEFLSRYVGRCTCSAANTRAAGINTVNGTASAPTARRWEVLGRQLAAARRPARGTHCHCWETPTAATEAVS